MTFGRGIDSALDAAPECSEPSLSEIILRTAMPVYPPSVSDVYDSRRMDSAWYRLNRLEHLLKLKIVVGVFEQRKARVFGRERRF
jgi:hypothetical protein